MVEKEWEHGAVYAITHELCETTQIGNIHTLLNTKCDVCNEPFIEKSILTV